MRNDQERLQDILDAITQIERYVIQGQNRFNQDELVQVWVIYHLQIIGEASRSLSEEFTSQHSEIMWSEIIAFRNILIHEYFRVNLKIIWRIIERDLPELKLRIESILRTE